MSIITASEVGISQSGDGIKIRIGGRTHILPAREALLVSNGLGNAAVNTLKSIQGLPTVNDIHLRPFDKGGVALLRFSTNDGPLILSIDQGWLKALADAAHAALELGSTAGSA